jgi:hypothetical protein
VHSLFRRWRFWGDTVEKVASQTLYRNIMSAWGLHMQ